ncbi:facilitated trehalose transporter Tret1-like isoform X2 [Adelges cooleyi]|uniref:facilitated trehalose transporter Tret1-like isoform X2 n=1 Tax=Adelges cooleyi TaxID=133065 RepID=UPI002180318B|nr:facilitated trehalose transporter Tret1-like isoform X2 [Adelges cooleyi]
MLSSIFTTSIPFLVCPIGLIVIGVLTDGIGRKKSLQVSYIPLVLGWFILSYAQSLNAIIIGRIMLGFSLGTGSCVYLYLAEVCPAAHRPLFFGLITVSVSLGMFTMPVMAPDYDWRTLSLMNAVLSVTGVLALFAVPESPMWLWYTGRDQQAKATERWWGMVDLLPVATSNTAPKITTPATWSVYSRPSVWKPALHGLVFFACQQGTGFYVLMFNSVDVLQKFRVPCDGITITTWMSAARIAGSVTYAFLYYVNRTTLTVVSSLGMFVGLFTIIGYLVIFNDVQDPPYGWLTLPPAFLLYVFFSVLGTLPLPWAMCGELFPMGVKGTMNGLVYSCGFIVMFVAIQIYPALVLDFGIITVWSIFAVFCLLSAAYGAFLMPETKGRSLAEILEYFEEKDNTGKRTSAIK